MLREEVDWAADKPSTSMSLLLFLDTLPLFERLGNRPTLTALIVPCRQRRRRKLVLNPLWAAASLSEMSRSSNGPATYEYLRTPLYRAYTRDPTWSWAVLGRTITTIHDGFLGFLHC